MASGCGSIVCAPIESGNNATGYFSGCFKRLRDRGVEAVQKADPRYFDPRALDRVQSYCVELVDVINSALALAWLTFRELINFKLNLIQKFSRNAPERPTSILVYVQLERTPDLLDTRAI
jgi:hypothetical protein